MLDGKTLLREVIFNTVHIALPRKQVHNAISLLNINGNPMYDINKKKSVIDEHLYENSLHSPPTFEYRSRSQKSYCFPSIIKSVI